MLNNTKLRYLYAMFLLLLLLNKSNKSPPKALLTHDRPQAT